MMIRGVQGLGLTDAECVARFTDLGSENAASMKAWNGACVDAQSYALFAGQQAIYAAATTPEGYRKQALINGTQQGLWLTQKWIDFLTGYLAQGGWNQGQRKTIQNALDSAQSHLIYVKSLAAGESPELTTAGLQLVAADVPLNGGVLPLSAELQRNINDLKGQIGVFADQAKYDQMLRDAQAADAASAAAGAATRAAIDDCSYYKSNNIPSQFVPARCGGSMPAGNIPVTSVTGDAPNQSVQPRDTSVPLPLSMSPGNNPLSALNSVIPSGFLTGNIGSTGIPVWVGLAGAGVVLYMMSGKHR